MDTTERLTDGWSKRVPLYGLRWIAALYKLAAHENRPRTNMLRECVKREAARQGMWQEEEGVL